MIQIWFLDFDLAILSQSKENYNNYTKRIREEYRTVPNFIYKKGRKKVLQHFIKKTSIFATADFRAKNEKIAKENLTNELQNI